MNVNADVTYCACGHEASPGKAVLPHSQEPFAAHALPPAQGSAMTIEFLSPSSESKASQVISQLILTGMK